MRREENTQQTARRRAVGCACNANSILKQAIATELLTGFLWPTPHPPPFFCVLGVTRFVVISFCSTPEPIMAAAAQSTAEPFVVSSFHFCCRSASRGLKTSARPPCTLRGPGWRTLTPLPRLCICVMWGTVSRAQCFSIRSLKENGRGGQCGYCFNRTYTYPPRPYSAILAGFFPLIQGIPTVRVKTFPPSSEWGGENYCTTDSFFRSCFLSKSCSNPSLRHYCPR